MLTFRPKSNAKFITINSNTLLYIYIYIYMIYLHAYKYIIYKDSYSRTNDKTSEIELCSVFGKFSNH